MALDAKGSVTQAAMQSRDKGTTVDSRQQKACLYGKGEREGASVGRPHVVPAARQAVEGAVGGAQLHGSDGVARVADAKHEPGSQTQ